MRDTCGICSIYGTEDLSKNEMESLIDQNQKKLDRIVEAKHEEDEEKKEDDADKRDGGNPIKEITFVKLGEPQDFDSCPTELYLSLMRKDWDAAKERCKECPEEASIPIYRKEQSGKLRWKLLPIHACVIFGATPETLDVLLSTFPEGARQVDDQGMVPLHLAMRMASPAPVMEKLIAACPDCLTATDRKKRTPRDLVARHNSEITKNTLLSILDSCETKYGSSIPEQPSVESETGSETTASEGDGREPAEAVPVREVTTTTTTTTSSPSEPTKSSPADTVQTEDCPTSRDDPASAVLRAIETPRAPPPRETFPEHTTASRAGASQHEQLIESLRVAHEQAFESLKIEHAQSKQIFQITHQKEMDALKTKHKEAYDKLATESHAKHAILNERVLTLESSLASLGEEHAKLKVEFEDVSAKEAAFREEHDTLKQVAETAQKSKETTEMANKAVITNLVNQVGDLQTQLTTETSLREAAVQHKEETENKQKGDSTRNNLKISMLERQMGQLTYTKEELETKLAEVEAKYAEAETANAALTEQQAALQEKADTAQKKLEEVTMSEQELAWKTNSLHEKLKGLEEGDPTDVRIANLENERKELKATIETLSVKLYKVVGFLDEMVQEQDAIIVESMTTDGDALESEEDRQKLVTNVTSMKEQIGAVIDSVIDGMPEVEPDSMDEDEIDENDSIVQDDDDAE